MSKYIDAEKLIAEIERRKKQDVTFRERSILIDIETAIASLQHESPIQINTLTWKDINDIERIINNVHYEFRNGIGAKSFGEEVLERFREERDELEQPEVELDFQVFAEEMDAVFNLPAEVTENTEDNPLNWEYAIARHFYELGKTRKEE